MNQSTPTTLTAWDRIRFRFPRLFLRSLPVSGSGRAGCVRCLRIWLQPVRPHVTHTPTGNGYFALCVGCRGELGTPESRWPFYMAVLSHNNRQGVWTPSEFRELASMVKASVWREGTDG